MRHIREMKSRYPMTYNHEVLTGPGVVESIYKATDGDAIICTEVGQNQMWAAQFYKYKEPRQFISSGGLGTMGYGLGAALGAKLGCPDRIVVNVAGDGCFRMNMNDWQQLPDIRFRSLKWLSTTMYLVWSDSGRHCFMVERYSATVFK